LSAQDRISEKRLQELAGIINSKSQLVDAAAELAKKQITAAQIVLGQPTSEKASPLAIEVAKIIATNLALQDLVSTK
jgi:hypothetical protein